MNSKVPSRVFTGRINSSRQTQINKQESRCLFGERGANKCSVFFFFFLSSSLVSVVTEGHFDAANSPLRRKKERKREQGSFSFTCHSCFELLHFAFMYSSLFSFGERRMKLWNKTILHVQRNAAWSLTRNANSSKCKINSIIRFRL